MTTTSPRRALPSFSEPIVPDDRGNVTRQTCDVERDPCNLERATQKPMAESFEDLRVWQTARALTNAVYEHTETGAFSQDFGLRDQIHRTPGTNRAKRSLAVNLIEFRFGLEESGARSNADTKR